MSIIDTLKNMGVINDYVQIASVLETNKASISDIKSGRKKLSIEMLRRMKSSYPNVNIEYIIMGDGDMFHSHKQQEPSTFEDKLLNIIQERDIIIIEQAEEIGRLKERILQLERERGKDASDVPSSGTANVG